MKKFQATHGSLKKIPLDLEEHKELASDLRKAQEILEPWINRFYISYSVNGKEVKQLKKVLKLLSSEICCLQDDHWYQIPNQEHNSPYYGKGKVAWI